MLTVVSLYIISLTVSCSEFFLLQLDDVTRISFIWDYFVAKDQQKNENSNYIHITECTVNINL